MPTLFAQADVSSCCDSGKLFLQAGGNNSLVNMLVSQATSVDDLERFLDPRNFRHRLYFSYAVQSPQVGLRTVCPRMAYGLTNATGWATRARKLAISEHCYCGTGALLLRTCIVGIIHTLTCCAAHRRRPFVPGYSAEGTGVRVWLWLWSCFKCCEPLLSDGQQ